MPENGQPDPREQRLYDLTLIVGEQQFEIRRLQSELARKDAAIADLAEAHDQIKKEFALEKAAKKEAQDEAVAKIMKEAVA